MAAYTLTQLKALVEPVARRHGAQKVSVFGSYARGQVFATPIYFYEMSGQMKTLLHIIAFQLDMEEALGRRVDVITSDINDKAFLERIRPDEVTLYER